MKDLAKEPIEGRLDVLAYKITERVAMAIEANNPILKDRLWKQADKPVQQLIRQHVPNLNIKMPPEVSKLMEGQE